MFAPTNCTRAVFCPGTIDNVEGVTAPFTTCTTTLTVSGAGGSMVSWIPLETPLAMHSVPAEKSASAKPLTSTSKEVGGYVFWFSRSSGETTTVANPISPKGSEMSVKVTVDCPAETVTRVWVGVMICGTVLIIVKRNGLVGAGVKVMIPCKLFPNVMSANTSFEEIGSSVVNDTVMDPATTLLTK